MLVNKKQLASILGKSERTLTEWQKHPNFPINRDAERGASNQYETEDVIDWITRTELERLSKEKPRDRKDRLSADMLEIELSEKIGGLVLADDVEQQITALVIAVKTEITNGNHKLKNELDSLYEIDIDLELLDEHSRTILNTLSGYQPVVDESGAEVCGEVQAA